MSVLTGLEPRSPARLRREVEGLNQLLTVAYGAEMRLSVLLSQFGFDEQQVETVRVHHVDQVVQFFISSLRERVVAGSDGERLYRVCSRRYGLNGEPPETLERIGQDLGISRERVRQLQQKVVKRCRSRAYKRFLEAALRETVARVVGVPRRGDVQPASG